MNRAFKKGVLQCCAIVVILLVTGRGFGMQLLSNDFSSNERFPMRFTCDGAGVSPSVYWKDVPAETKSFALILEDPDAPSGIFTHWLIFNLPPEERQLSEAMSQLPDGAQWGLTSWEHSGYGGPCPPRGQTHRYIFKLYALDTLLQFSNPPVREKLLQTMDGHILAKAELISTYQRS